MSAAYDVYTRLLVQLHGFIAQGKGESAEADAIRNQMDTPWKLMTPDEVRVAEQASERFYRIAGAKPGTMVYAEIDSSMDIAGKLVKLDWVNGKAKVDFGGTYGVQDSPIESVDLYDLT